MKKISIWILWGMLALCLAGCGGQEDELYSQVTREVAGSNQADPSFSANTLTPPYYPELAKSTPVPNDTLSGELLIKGFRPKADPPEIYWLAREFMELHPNVTITLEFEYNYWYKRTRAERRMDMDNYYEKMRLDLAADEADYLLYAAAENLDYYAMTQSGVLRDMREMLETDPDIHPEELFMPAIEAFRINGKQTVLPYSFMLSEVYLRKDIMRDLGVDVSTLKSVDSDQLLDWYEQARELDPDLQFLFTAPGKDQLFTIEKLRYMEPETGWNDFQSPDFLRFLDRTRNVINDDPLLDPVTEIGYGDGSYMEGAMLYRDTGEVMTSAQWFYDGGYPEDKNVVTKSRSSFAKLSDVDIYELINMYEQSFHYLAGPFPLTSTDNKLGLSVFHSDFMMPMGLKNTELAWEFIKYCLAEREDLTFDRFGNDTCCGYYDYVTLSVNKSNFIRKAEHAADTVGVFYTRDGAEMFHFEPVDGAALAEYLEEILASHTLVDLGKYNIDLRDYLNEYYVNELTTPEQCAKRISDRVMIWMNE